jgi:hypothetical protein
MKHLLILFVLVCSVAALGCAELSGKHTVCGPIPQGATVELLSNGEPVGTPTYSNDSTWYSYSDVQGGGYILKISNPGYVTMTVPLVISGDVVTTTVVMMPNSLLPPEL